VPNVSYVRYCAQRLRCRPSSRPVYHPDEHASDRWEGPSPLAQGTGARSNTRPLEYADLRHCVLREDGDGAHALPPAFCVTEAAHALASSCFC
jgi:hypothetical protein